MYRLVLLLWIIIVILFFILFKYGVYFLMLIGVIMVGVNIVWVSLRNVNEFIILFSVEYKFEFYFGLLFYLNFIMG